MTLETGVYTHSDPLWVHCLVCWVDCGQHIHLLDPDVEQHIHLLNSLCVGSTYICWTLLCVEQHIHLLNPFVCVGSTFICWTLVWSSTFIC